MVLRLIEDEKPTLSKDTTPTGGRTVKYRVLGRAFVNGALVDPGDGAEVFVMSTPGLHGGPLEQVDPPLDATSTKVKPPAKPAG